MTLLNICLVSVQSFIKIGGAVLEKIEHMIQRDIHLLLLGYNMLIYIGMNGSHYWFIDLCFTILIRQNWKIRGRFLLVLIRNRKCHCIWQIWWNLNLSNTVGRYVYSVFDTEKICNYNFTHYSIIQFLENNANIKMCSFSFSICTCVS